MEATPILNRSVTSAVPTRVADLASDSHWLVTMTSSRQWVTAERTFVHDERHWTVGLTPVGTDVVALIVWCEGDVVGHARGTESDMCAAAADWVYRVAPHGVS